MNLTRQKSLFLLILTILIFGITPSCKENLNEESYKYWLDQKIDISQIISERDSFNIINGAGDKVGSMVWEKSINGSIYLMEDYSQFDDGSVNETASFYFDLDSMKMSKVLTEMSFQSGGFNLDFIFKNQIVNGKFQINRDSSQRTMDIDSTFNFDIVRGEIYMMLSTLLTNNKSKFSFNTFVSTSISTTKSSIEILDQEEITVPAGIFNTTKIQLNGGGKMPDNTLWVSNKFPRKIVKVSVGGQDLDLVLVN